LVDCESVVADSIVGEPQRTLGHHHRLIARGVEVQELVQGRRGGVGVTTSSRLIVHPRV
jgi:hypothetical protein